MTCVGKLNLRVPKLRMGTYFPEDILARYSRTDRAVIAAITEMVTNGVSTRKVSKVAGQFPTLAVPLFDFSQTQPNGIG